MAVSYAGSSDWTLQAGSGAETSPEGLVTVTEIWKGKTSTRSTFITSKPARTTVSVMTGYTSLTSISAPRFTEDGAYSTAYIVFQGAPSSSGTVESELDINYRSEVRTVKLKLSESDDSATYNVSYVSPMVEASYIAGSKPGSFRFAGIANGENDPEIDLQRVEPFGKETPKRTSALVEGTDYKVTLESKFVERRNVGGIWHVTEQHAKVIGNLNEA